MLIVIQLELGFIKILKKMNANIKIKNLKKNQENLWVIFLLKAAH